MINNLRSLSLLRNGKVYLNKELAMQGLTQAATNDGVAKLARYILDENGVKIIRTIVGFYANAPEMEEAGGGNSSYTILDIDGISDDVASLSGAIDSVNAVIGGGIPDKTLTQAIADTNSKFGSGITSANTVTAALEELSNALTSALTITIESDESAEYAKVYTIKQGGVSVGTINIPKDMVIKSGSVVKGTWVDDTFIEDPEGDDVAIKLVLSNDDVIYLNAKDLVNVYTPGNGITIDSNVISIKLDTEGEPFLTVGEDGLKLYGVQTAIDTAVNSVKLVAGDGINILSNNKIKAVAALNSDKGISNPIFVDENGIKFSKNLDCGFFDDKVEIVSSAEDIAAITDPQDTSVVVTSQAAASAASGTKFKNITVTEVPISNLLNLSASETIEVDSLSISGAKDPSSNGKVLFSAENVYVDNVTVENGSTIYNVFEGDQTTAMLEGFYVDNVVVDSPSLRHNVFNIYKPVDGCEIVIKNSSFNLTVDNSNVLRLANYANAKNVTVTFEDVDWTYDNSITSEDWAWAGLIIYQPASSDNGLNGNLSDVSTWSFKFKNCTYNSVKVTSNNFGEHNQVFYTYNVGNDGSIRDPEALGLTLVFE